ncbi:mechanosensitive ion channel family protein [Pseudorhodoferax sp. Leaf267]|uniref:mechanosensitive ion channel family protein n=1 Tax=Pseudorhodoferax sp. Leaf267 TaxID=1736316 RepID=UPI0006FBA737|nr:mechanosensitive ion channel family protein [Pseudorhodoferax sp. Leaf267]KQP23044.1 mechanosensitive ion channel protein MscS [Pseudorhodoferax sp. Leaf267]
MDITTWFKTTTLAGITLPHWTIALASAIAAYLAMTTVLGLVRSRILQRAQTTPDAAGRSSLPPVLALVLNGTSHWLLLAASVLVGLSLLDLPTRWSDRVAQLWYVTVALQLALWGARLIDVLMQRQLLRHVPAGSSPQASVSHTLIGWGLNTALWAIVALAILSNLGFNITAFIASMGIGGIAIALAAQNILGDLFASVAIALDKPFEVGDAINTGTVNGTVEHVGMKTTRLRSPGGEQIVVSNTELLKGSLRNFKRMQTRRIEFTFGVSYATTPEQAGAIPGVVRRVVEAQPELVFDRAHFSSFGDSALNYVVVYIMQTPNYGQYMDNQQAINIGLMREFAAMGVDFAFPTRTVVLAPPGGAASALNAGPPVAESSAA